MRFDDRCELPFGDLLAIPLRNGLTRPKRVRGKGAPMVNMGELFANRRIGDIPMERVPLHTKHPDRDLLAKHDLLFARQSIIAEGAGKVSLFLGADEPTTFEGHLIRARIDQDKADPEWLFYFFESSLGRERIKAIVYQTTAAGIRGSDLAHVPVLSPDLEEQHRIVGVLRPFDDKIENNRKIAKTLEEIAAAIFRAHFVDFVDHDELVESEIGPIPRGWNVTAIGDALSVVGGGTPSTKNSEYWDGGSHCWATPKDLSGLDMPVLLGTARHITGAGVRRISSGLLPSRTTLMSSRAPVGYTAIAFVPVAVNQGFIAVPPSGQIPSEYVLFWLRENMGLIKANAGGTTFAEISKRAFRPLPMLIPPSQVLEDFRQVVEPILDRIAVCSRENVVLAALRDALLPRLVSGEIRVATGSCGRSLA